MVIRIKPLAEYLNDIPDFRKAKGLRHPLKAILCVCCAAMISGAKNPRAIAIWCRHRQDLESLLQRLGFPHPYGPSKSTLYRVLSRVILDTLTTRIQRWIEENWSQFPPLEADDLEGVAVDGKVLVGSRRQGADQTHLMSALSHRLGVTLGQLAVEDKTNEIGAMPDLLADLVLIGRVFTMDALLTQRQVAETIVAGHGDYVMVVKENQPTLYQDIGLLFTTPNATDLIEDRVSTVDKGHGRIERRTLETSSALRDYLDWPGVQQVFRLDRQTVIVKTGEIRAKTVYGISSLPKHRADARQLLKLSRGHWGIENRSHWVRDVTFGEDGSQVRNGTLPEVMATLRTCAISLLRIHGYDWIPDGFDFFASHPFEALAAIGC